MQHLSIETLARLVEEAPSHLEALHLESCLHCRRELNELREQTRTLAELPELQPPAEQWTRLEARLREEGLIRSSHTSQPWWSRAPLRMAAALALFLLGGLAGAAITGGGGAAPTLAERGDPRVTATTATAEDAAQLLREREEAYLTALASYAELTGNARPVDPAARLAALEGIVLTTRAALEEAPADPVINGYHLMAVGQREAVLRQIASTARDPWY